MNKKNNVKRTRSALPVSILRVSCGDVKSHSEEFAEGACRKVSQSEEHYYRKGTAHMDLYDHTDSIPLQPTEGFL